METTEKRMSEKLINSITSDRNVDAAKALEKLLQLKCANKIKKVLSEE